MRTLSRFSLRLQSLVLIGLLPGLVILTAILGVSIYRPLRSVIMTGFDQKLFAVSTVTGSFIRGEDHQTLFEGREITALAPDPAHFAYLGAETETGRLFRIDPLQGGALEAGLVPEGVTGIALDPRTNRFWAGTADPARLYAVEPETGEAELLMELRTAPMGLAYDPRSGLLFAGGERLTSLDPRSGAQYPVAVEGLEGAVRGPTVDPAINTLYLLSGEDRLVTVDLASWRVSGSEELFDPEPPTEEEILYRSGPPPVMESLAFVAGRGLVGSADRLVKIDPRTAAVDSSETAPGFRSSQHPLYARYVAPMQRIMEKKDITYLYTESVELGGRLTYGIDGTTGEDHSIIGSMEAIAGEEMPGMERALVEGVVRLSDIEDWGEWGLLKTADAPIYRRDGSISALASADVDITHLRDRTRVALVKVGAMAALTLILGALISLVISRRLVAPLTQVKEGALQLAAGRYGHRLPDQELLELRELSDSFNKMSDALADTISELTRTNESLESIRRRRALEVALADYAEPMPPDSPLRVEQWESVTGIHDPSGYVFLDDDEGGRLLVWLAEPAPDEALGNVQYRREVAAIARPMLALGEDWDRLGTFLLDLNPRTYCVALLDAGGRSIRAVTRRESRMAVVDEGNAVRVVDLGDSAFELAPTEWLVLSSGDPVVDAKRVLERRLGKGAAIVGTSAADTTRAHAAHAALRRHGEGGGDLVICLLGRDVTVEAPRPPRQQLRIEVAQVVPT